MRFEEGAKRLGAAFQKVNFLRDLAADHDALGRSYFPGVDVASLSEADKERILDDIDADLRMSGAVIPDLPASSRRAVALAQGLFAELAVRLRATPAADLARTGSIGEGVPPALADLLLGPLERLPDPVRTVVRCASITSQPVSDRLLRRVAGLDDASVDEALRLAVAEGLLVPDGTGYGFPHDLLRAAVHDDLLPGERARLHAARAAALASGRDATASPAEIAHHFAEAGDATVMSVAEMNRLPLGRKSLTSTLLTGSVPRFETCRL